MNNRVNLGRIINTRGLKGEVKIESSTDFPLERYKKGNEIYLHNDSTNDDILVHPVSCSVVGKFNFVKFEEIISIEQADLYRGYYVQVNINSLHKLENSYYYHELIGINVIDESGNILGVVENVEEYPKQAILRIKGQKNFLVPFVDQFIINVDIKNKIIKIKVMEGLI